jgi:hypothetical protein
MADRLRNCWACCIFRPLAHKVPSPRRKIEASPDPATVRKQIADSWVARGNNLQPRSMNAIYIAPCGRVPPPIPSRPARLGVASVDTKAVDKRST